MRELASVVIVTYNHVKFIKRCIESVRGQRYPHEIIVVDNVSADGTADVVRENFPDVTLIESGVNLGYGGGNNLGVRHSSGDYVVILNPDTIVAENWLKHLIEPLKKDDKLITTPRILTYDGSMINTCGNINHFTGLTFTRFLGAYPGSCDGSGFVSGVSGCCFAMRRRGYDVLGGFDERFFAYNEDSDLSWRAHLLGFRVLYVSGSVLRHDYRLRVPAEKIYHLEKGRYMTLRKYLSKRDILLFSPSLFLAELLTLGYAVKSGWKGLNYKLLAVKDGLMADVDRSSGDKTALFGALSPTIPANQLTSNRAERVFKVLANRVFEWNYKVVKKG